MKKILLVGLLLISTLSYSQVEKGDIAVGGNFSLQSDKYEGADAVNMSQFAVKGGYFFTDNIEAGASVLVIGADDVTMVGWGPYAAYNFLTDGGKFLPYLGANYYSFNTGIEGVDAVNQIGGVGGFKYFLTEVVNIDTSINYTSYLGDYTGSSIRLNIGIGINLGKLD